MTLLATKIAVLYNVFADLSIGYYIKHQLDKRFVFFYRSAKTITI
jgi:hypothetical protein